VQGAIAVEFRSAMFVSFVFGLRGSLAGIGCWPPAPYAEPSDMTPAVLRGSRRDLCRLFVGDAHGLGYRVD
jgi:hypothetical protein